jgi:hypothetical protein
MGTRSRIGIVVGNKVHSVYCHWDGYVEGVGVMLACHYDDFAKISQVIALGDLSSLNPEIGEKHDFDDRFEDSDPRSNWSRFYGRDRGETGCEYRTHDFAEDMSKCGDCAEYMYIFGTDGVWYYSDTDKIDWKKV